MTRSIERSIDNVDHVLSSQLERIDSLPESDSLDACMKRILWFSFLDELSNIIFPDLRGPGNSGTRFSRFIEQYSGWVHFNKISLPHLRKLLENEENPRFKELIALTDDLYHRWFWGEVITIDRDPDYETIERLWPREKGKKIKSKKIDLEKLKHVKLLYEMRNGLIHELRSQGRISWDPAPSEAEPYYTSLQFIPDSGILSEQVWELQYPVEFYKNIATKGKENVISKIRKENIDPWVLSKYSTYWIESLKD